MEKVKNKYIFSKEEKENIINLYLYKDYSSIEIGKIYGVSWRFILNKLKEWNVKIRKKYSYTERRKIEFKKKIKEKQKRGEDWGKGKLGTGLEFDLEKINYEHWENEKSLRDIAKELGCSEFPIRKALIKNKYKIRKTNVKTKRSVRKQSKARKGKTLEEIYKPEIVGRMKKQLIDNRKKQVFPVKDSTIEIKIQNFLKELKIEFLTHQYMKIPRGYQCDIFVQSLKMVIECDGCYWHGCKDCMKELNNKQKKQHAKDNKRTKELKGKGFKVLRLWEHEIKAMNIEQFKNKLKEVTKK